MTSQKNQRPAILVVDDKQENLFAMQQALDSLNAEIVLANSGEEALAYSLQQSFALVLLDVQMPDMDGFETAALLHANHETASLPIIFVTAIHKEPQSLSRAYDLGVVDYLYKPVDKKVLLSKVHTFLLLEQQRYELSTLTESLKEATDRQALLLDNAGEGIIGMNTTGQVTFINPRACELLERNQDSLIHKDIHQLFNNSIIHQQFSSWQTACNESEISALNQQRCQLKKMSGEKIPIEFSMSPLVNLNHQFHGGVLLFQDISERKKQEEKLLHEAHHDSLTGLANRMLLHEFLTASIARNKRQRKHTALLFLDLDKFKQVNDMLGHETGDMLLSHTAKRLKQCVRDSDLIARLGGDEFVIVLDEIAQSQDITIIAKKITDTLSEPFYVNEHSITVGASIGIALWPDDGDSPEMMVKAADHAMYQAKQQGGNSFCFSTPFNTKTCF